MKSPKRLKLLGKSDMLQKRIRIIIDSKTVNSIVTQCRDEKDNFLLALAKDSKADFLITGDEDLLIIKKFQNTEILTYSEFSLKL